jgi:hypothetical protein
MNQAQDSGPQRSRKPEAETVQCRSGSPDWHRSEARQRWQSARKPSGPAEQGIALILMVREVLMIVHKVQQAHFRRFAAALSPDDSRSLQEQREP